MDKAFIFDFDGVILNNEPHWEVAKKEIYQNLFGQEIFICLGQTTGLSMDDIYNKAVRYGATIEKEEMVKKFQNYALKIYKEAPITPGVDLLGEKLANLGYKIGVVSASPMEWLKITFDRTRLKNYISYYLSLYDRKDLRHKPAPDGYLEAINKMAVSSKNTVILEDSNTGIESAKNAGAFVVGFKENLLKGYTQNNADVYANNMEEVITILKKRI